MKKMTFEEFDKLYKDLPDDEYEIAHREWVMSGSKRPA